MANELDVVKKKLKRGEENGKCKYFRVGGG